eukprot:2257918-Pleurochrysis_carterae.AAC.5
MNNPCCVRVRAHAGTPPLVRATAEKSRFAQLLKRAEGGSGRREKHNTGCNAAASAFDARPAPTSNLPSPNGPFTPFK